MLQTISRSFLLMATLAAPLSVFAADRTTLFVPRAAEDPAHSDALEFSQAQFPDQAMGPHAEAGWKAYVRLWKAHHADPADRSIRRFLGLPLDDAFTWSARRGRSAPRHLRWTAGSYAHIDTAHFTLFSRATEAPSRRVAEDLERCYWVWTQMFFPLWEGAPQVRAGLADWNADQSANEFLEQSSARITVRRKMRVVLFRDAEEYQRTLAADYPGVERSTGFYAIDKQTIFLYASEEDDSATRRHELVHQLFREATRSALGRSFPAEDEGFWLIEGIAGYFESLFVTDEYATVGGWDCSRLQFARYRSLVLGDVMPMQELIRDGRIAAQQRSDIARWYAHAIAQTHRLMDGDQSSQRAWVYDQLARRYRISNSELAKVDEEAVLKDSEARLREYLRVDDDHLRANPVHRRLENLVLAECPISRETVAQLPPSPSLKWLDLTRIELGNDDVARLMPDPSALEQLRLEATAIDAGIAPWIAKTRQLLELDLSWTAIDDSVLEVVENRQAIEVLYLTGSRVTDRSIDAIIAMPNLETVDLQRTGVTEAGLARLKAARPQIEVNPLKLR